jgi:RNA polymerase-binding protein DksA
MNSKSPSLDQLSESFHFPTRWAWHGKTLLLLRDRLQQQAHSHLSELSALKKDDPDFAARAAEESELESLLAEVHSEEGQLVEIEAALDRLRNGTYGFCQASGRPISAERLRAVPWTRFCRERAAALEK